MNTLTVKICSFTKDTIESFRQKKRFPESVIRALEKLRKARLIKKSYNGRKKEQEQLFITQHTLRRFLRKEMVGSKDYFTDIEQNIESRLALVYDHFPSVSDFTFYLQRGENDLLGNLLLPVSPRKCPSDPLPVQTQTSRESEMWLWDKKAGRAASGRVVVCSAFRGTQWSVTFRLQNEYPKGKKKGNFYNNLNDISDILYQTVFRAQGTEMHGLIVISGRTGSGKSQIAHRLIESYIRDLKNSGHRDRIPHLVAFEDPIEKVFKIGEADYTPRENELDAKNLGEVVRNALRQTPAVTFVGETRNPEEWKHLLQFAGTGHLVITTSHAGSLVEAMGNILEATESRTTAARSIVADRLLAVVHIINGTEAETGISFLIPALWHRTPSGINALMSEGLSSLLPYTPPELSRHKGEKPGLPGSISRYWFARELIKRAEEAKNAHGQDQNSIKTKVQEKAMEWDLEGV